jgi:hypothetical protein
MDLSQLEQLRHFSKWLLLIPAAMFTLFSIGQIGIFMSQKIAETKMPLTTGMEDGPWAYVLIHSSNSENQQGTLWGIAPSGEQVDEASGSVAPTEPAAVVLVIPTTTDAQPLPSSTPFPSGTLTPVSESTATPTMESAPSATDPSGSFTPTPTNSTSNKFCDARGEPLSYDDLHLHTANVEDDGFGTIIHAVQIDDEETLVELETVTVTQSQENPQILEVVSVDWSHWGMGSTRIDVQQAQAEITIHPNLEFYACFVEGKCDHSLYGGEIYIDFDGELSGKYRLSMNVYFPEYDEKCKLDLNISVEP